MKRTPLRVTAGRVAVGATAALAALVSVAPPTFADDLAPETNETTTPDSEPADEPADEPEEKNAAEPEAEKEDVPAPEVQDTLDETPDDDQESSDEVEGDDELAQVLPRLAALDAPPGVATDDFAPASQDTDLTIDVLDNDLSLDGFSELFIRGGPNHGTASVSGAGRDARIVYTPDAGYAGSDSLTYSYTNGSGLSSNISVVSIQVAPREYVSQTFTIGAQIAPGAYAPGASTAGSTFLIDLVGPDGARSSMSCEATLDGEGSAHYCTGGDLGSTEGVELLMAPSGSTFILAAGHKATITQTSAFGGLVPAAQPVTVDRTETADTSTDVLFDNVGQLPTVGSRSYGDVDPDEPTDLDVLAGDTVGDPDTSLSITGGPSIGSVEVITPIAGDQRGGIGALADASRPFIRFTPAANQPEGTQTFTYTATNSNGTTNDITVTLDVESAEIAPNYGTQKIYVGAQIKDGSWVPAGTTVDGLDFRIDVTNQDGTTTTAFCTADAIAPDGRTAECDSYTLASGATARITPVDVPSALTSITPSPQVVEPCDLDETDCDDVDVPFTFVGPVAEVKGNTAVTVEGDSVVVDVLANDDNPDPTFTKLEAGGASHGTVKVIGESGSSGSVPPNEEPDDGGGMPDLCSIIPLPGCDGGGLGDICLLIPDFPLCDLGGLIPATAAARTASAQAAPALARAFAGAGSLAIRYTPAAGFSGTDTFSYRIRNSNGLSSVASVTVTVDEGTVTDADVAGEDQALPDTGGSDGRWLALGALMTAAGGVLVSRRRRTVAE